MLEYASHGNIVSSMPLSFAPHEDDLVLCSPHLLLYSCSIHGISHYTQLSKANSQSLDFCCASVLWSLEATGTLSDVLLVEPRIYPLVCHMIFSTVCKILVCSALLLRSMTLSPNFPTTVSISSAFPLLYTLTQPSTSSTASILLAHRAWVHPSVDSVAPATLPCLGHVVAV